MTMMGYCLAKMEDWISIDENARNTEISGCAVGKGPWLTLELMDSGRRWSEEIAHPPKKYVRTIRSDLSWDSVTLGTNTQLRFVLANIGNITPRSPAFFLSWCVCYAGGSSSFPTVPAPYYVIVAGIEPQLFMFVFTLLFPYIYCPFVCFLLFNANWCRYWALNTKLMYGGGFCWAGCR